MSGKNIQIAVVDDDESFARAIGRLLRASGFEVVVFHSGEEFLQAGASDLVACLVADIELGGMSGLDLGHLLGKKNPGLPIIYVTALEENGANAPLQAGSDFLRKPVSALALINAIHQAIRRKQSANHHQTNENHLV